MNRSAWYPVAATRDLRAGPAKAQLLGTPLVIWRSEDGYGALADICPHRGAPLSEGCVDKAAIACPYHGWHFDTDGQCVAMPALADTPPRIRAQAFATAEHDGLVFVQMEGPGHGFSPPPPQQDIAFATREDNVTIRASLADMAENILDTTHTSVVHAGYLRQATRRQLVQPDVRCGADWIEVIYPESATPSGLVSRLFGTECYEITDRFRAPGIAEVEYRRNGRIEFASRFYLSPASDNETRIFSRLSIRGTSLLSQLKVSIVRAMLRRVVSEDEDILGLVTDNVERFGRRPGLIAPQDFLRAGIDTILRGEAPARPDHIPPIYV